MAKNTILIVEDLNEQAETIKLQIEATNSNLKVSISNSAEEALEVLKGEKFDFILTDLNLTGMSGLKLAQQVLENYSESHIILMSGVVSLADEGKYFSIGIEQFLAKPFEMSDLMAVIKHPLSICNQSENLRIAY